MRRRKKGRKGGQEGEREGSLFSLDPDPVAHSHCGFDIPLGKMKFEATPPTPAPAYPQQDFYPLLET